MPPEPLMDDLVNSRRHMPPFRTRPPRSGALIMCGNHCYYSVEFSWGGDYDHLGASIVALLPKTPRDYTRWLQKERLWTKARSKGTTVQAKLGDAIEGREQPYSRSVIPWSTPQLGYHDSRHYYIINLDHETFTVDGSLHFRLEKVPKVWHAWVRLMTERNYDVPTLCRRDIAPKFLASLALELEARDWHIGYNFRLVSPKLDLEPTWKVFLANMMETVRKRHEKDIEAVGRVWAVDSMAFRELSFALVAIASGQTTLITQNEGEEHPQLCEICSQYGSVAGAAPMEARYWYQGVLVSLAPMCDGPAVTEAITWGRGQGNSSFMVAIMSLYEVMLAEVYPDPEDHGNPVVRLTAPLHLSPLLAEQSLSTHPFLRVPRETTEGVSIPHPTTTACARTTAAEHPWGVCPGIVALVNFFDIAAARRVFQGKSKIPVEIWRMILNVVDYETWQSCLEVSAHFRTDCLEHFNIAEGRALVGPPTKLDIWHWKGGCQSELAKFTTVYTPGEKERIARRKIKNNWAPLRTTDDTRLADLLIGKGRQVVMLRAVREEEIDLDEVEDEEGEAHELVS